MAPSASRTVNGSDKPASRSAIAVATYASTPSSDGTDVYHSVQSFPSHAAVRKSSACAACKGSSRTCRPSRLTACSHVAVVDSISFAAQSALRFRICPPEVSPRDAITGIEPTWIAASMPAVCTAATLPTRPYLRRLRYSDSNTPDWIEVARTPAACNASTSRRFCCWNTRRTIASVSGVFTRSPSTICLAMLAASICASSCGPAPCSTIGVSPTCCRNVSEDTNASSSSRRIAPPTLTTAKRAASSRAKRLR